MFGLLAIAGVCFFSCQNEGSSLTDGGERRPIDSLYDSLQNRYDSLMSTYETGFHSMPVDISTLYGRMQRMHQQMEISYRRYTASDMRDQMSSTESKSRMRVMHMQGHVTGEWYVQMMKMHEKLSVFHNRQGQQSMAESHRELSKGYKRLFEKSSELKDKTKVPFNDQGDSGQNLFARHCGSCHGNDQGVNDVFPSVSDKNSVPIRSFSREMPADIEIYEGSIPSFKAYLNVDQGRATPNSLCRD